MIKVSLIAASVREPLYNSFFESLENEMVSYEVIFAGHKPPQREWPELTYIPTGFIKPAQCYEIARREATGDVLVWTADDAESRGQILTKAYRYWEEQNDKKLILSLQTREFYLDGGDGFCNMKQHAFIGGKPETPLMAPLAMISREYVDELGGFDRRFLCGQYENLTVCQAYADGGRVEVFGDRESYIEIDHIKKSIDCGESSRKDEFFNRPFARGYKHDRRILEESVNIIGGVPRIKQFEPYEDEDLLTKSQSYKGEWE